MRLLHAGRILAVALVFVCVLVPDRLGRVGFGLAALFVIGVGWMSFVDALRRMRAGSKSRDQN